MTRDLKGKIIVVTGVSRGLGLALAREFLGQDAVVVGCANETGVKKICDGFIVDVSQEDAVNRFVDEIIKTYGRIDVLVNNAGWAGNKKAPIEEWTSADYHRIMATNTDSVFYFLKKTAPLFKKQKSGLIINISSGAGMRGHGGLAAYSASKFAVMGLTQSVAWELEGSNAKCVAVCPAGINTAMRATIFGEEDASRQQSPEAIAKIISQIASEEIKIPNGGDVYVKDGRALTISNPLGL